MTARELTGNSGVVEVDDFVEVVEVLDEVEVDDEGVITETVAATRPPTPPPRTRISGLDKELWHHSIFLFRVISHPRIAPSKNRLGRI